MTLPLQADRLHFLGHYALEGQALLALQLCGFFLHILLINLILGTVLITFAKNLFAKTPDIPPQVAPQLVALPKCLAIAVNIGVLPFLILQLAIGGYLYTATLLTGYLWFWVPFAVMLAYYGLYIYTAKLNISFGLRKLVLSLVCILLLGSAFIFVNTMSLMQNPLLWMQYAVSQTGTLLATADPALIPRYLHFIFACIAIAGLAQGYFGMRTVKQLEKAQESAAALLPPTQKARLGLTIFFHTTMLQLLIGVWFFLTLPSTQQKLFMGQHLGATICYGASFLFIILSLIAAKKRKATFAVACTLVVVACMVYMRFALRQSFMRGVTLDAGTGQPIRDAIYSATPPDGLVFFVVSFAATMVAIWYMLKVYNTRMPLPVIGHAPDYWEGPEVLEIPALQDEEPYDPMLGKNTVEVTAAQPAHTTNEYAKHTTEEQRDENILAKPEQPTANLLLDDAAPENNIEQQQRVPLQVEQPAPAIQKEPAPDPAHEESARHEATEQESSKEQKIL